MTAPLRWSSTERSLRPRRRSALRARSTTRISPPRDRILPGGRKVRARRTGFRRVLRQAVHQVRTAARDLSGVRTARLQIIPWPFPSGCAKSCSRKMADRRTAQARARLRQCRSPVHRASPVACGFRFFPRHSSARLFSPSTGREWSTTSLAVGDGNDLKIHKELHFRILSGCSTRPSPTTRASRSIPASTR